ncbi:hypothetical protein TNCV_351421 [Trichonephila clavipes]|nr:hypothetical protein TNCV_351421 [Trichonephila clavipes]
MIEWSDSARNPHQQMCVNNILLSFGGSSRLEQVVAIHSGKTTDWEASLSSTPSQWRYTFENSCPVVRQKTATASALSRWLGIGPTVARVSHGFPKLFVLGPCQCICRCVGGDNAPCSSEGQIDFRLI